MFAAERRTGHWCPPRRRAFTLVARVDGAPVTAPVVVRTEGLTKRFPEGLVAVDDLDLEVFEGDLYGFLGPNGAGKSTTIRMLLGLVFPTAGAVEVLGQAVPRHSSEALLDVGALDRGSRLLPPPVGAPEPPPVRRRRAQRARGTRRPRIEEVMERVGLADVGRRPVKAYSMGMRQRLGLAAALLRRPAPADPRRADQRPRPPGHPRAQDAVRRAGARGDDRVPLQPPPGRGGAHLHAGGHDGQRQAGRPGPGGRAAGADRTAAHRVARRLGGRGLPAHPAHDGRVARPAPPAGAPQRGAGRGGQQPARRPGPAHQRAGPGAADAGGRVPRAHGRHAVRAERGPVAVAAAPRAPRIARAARIARPPAGSVVEDGS